MLNLSTILIRNGDKTGEILENVTFAGKKLQNRVKSEIGKAALLTKGTKNPKFVTLDLISKVYGCNSSLKPIAAIHL